MPEESARNGSVAAELSARYGIEVSRLVGPTRARLVKVRDRARRSNRRMVDGHVVLPDGRPATRISLVVLQRRVGVSDPDPVAEAVTDELGFFGAEYGERTGGAAIEIRAIDASGREAKLTAPIYDAAVHETVNLVAPFEVESVQSEHQRLLEAVTASGITIDVLAEAKESTDQRDLALISGSTGWDQRHLALAALAQRSERAIGIPAAGLYAIARMGGPTDLDVLASMDSGAILGLVKAAESTGIVDFDGDVARVESLFQAFSSRQRLTQRAAGSVSSLDEQLSAAGFGDDDKRAALSVAFDGGFDGEDFYRELAAAGVDRPLIDTLNWQTQLGQVTLGNARLNASVSTQLRDRDLSRLADAGFHEAAAWVSAVDALADGTAASLRSVLPPAYQTSRDENLRGGLDAYAREMARRVRLAFPTQVISQLISSGSLWIGGALEGGADGVSTVLSSTNFDLSTTPVDTWLHENEAALPAPLSDLERRAVKAVQRVYNLTPDNDSMQVLLDAGLTSAASITALPRATFVAKHGHEFTNPGDAALVHRKAHQIRSVALSFVADVQRLRSQITLPVLGGNPTPFGAANGSATSDIADAGEALIAAFPTLESLFDNLDYCACAHCRSVLSPAAYLVHLLKFIDPSDDTWAGLDVAGSNPYKALIARRPDIPRILLTCENTNTQVPHIDQANAVMEAVTVDGLAGIQAGDTGDAESVDLLAEPASLHPDIEGQAYQALKAAAYPPPLPFDRATTTVRAFLGSFGVERWEVMAALGDWAPRTSSSFEVFLEQLQIGSTELGVLTGNNPAAADWHELYGLPGPADVEGELGNAKGLARRLDVDYRELVELVQTGFVNPGMVLLDPLRAVGVSAAIALRFVGAPSYEPLSTDEHDDVVALLGESGSAWLLDAFAADAFREAIVLRGDPGECDLSQMTVEPANGANPEALAGFYYRLNVFVRLRHMLGDWSIPELDAALVAFLPVGVPQWDRSWATTVVGLQPTDLASRVSTALVMMSHLDRLRERGPARVSREELVSIWSRVPARGRASVYGRQFLGTNDDYFDDSLGRYLSGPTDTLDEHLAAVQSGVGLTAEDIRAILTSRTGSPVGDMSTVVVDPDMLSDLFRHAVLARVLGLDIADLITFTTLLDTDPFPAASTTPFVTLADDQAYLQTLEFARRVAALTNDGPRPAELREIITNEQGPDDERTRSEFMITLRDQLHTVASEILELSDVDALTTEFISQKLGRVTDPATTETFTAMWTRTAPYVHSQPSSTNDLPESLDQEEGVSISAGGGNQVMRVSGAMTPKRMVDLLSRHQHLELPTIFQEMLDQAEAFLAHDLGEAALISNIELLFGPVPHAPAAATPQETRDHEQQHERRRRAQIAPTLRELIGRRMRERRALDAVSASLGLDEPRARLLLGGTSILAEPDTNPRTPLMPALLAAADQGCRLETFTEPELTGAATTFQVADFTWDSTVMAAGSLRLESLVTVPASGTYRLEATAPATVTLDGQDWIASGDSTGSIHLVAGALHRVVVEIANLNGADFRLDISADGLARGPLDRLQLLPPESARRVESAWRLTRAVCRLAEGFGLSNRELQLVFGSSAGMPLVALPASPMDPVTDEVGSALARLADYLALRRDTVGERDDLAGVLDGADLRPIAETAELLARLLQVSPTLVLDTAAHLFSQPRDAFLTPDAFTRLFRLLHLARGTGLGTADLADAASPEPDATRLRNAVRARCDEPTWRNVAKPIFDRLRQQRRDALVAHLVHTLDDVDTKDQLFELLLLDPGNEPVVATSRIQLAIASVQLFIQRCFLNLEPAVRPGALNAGHWEWMKWYRVWEANMKIFLRPENYLLQEFRDDKTPLFAELESSLLTDDVTDERAEAAIHHYLRGLEEISRLEIVSFFREEGEQPTDHVLHVLARSSVKPRKHYYRTYSSTHEAWTPWEPVDADVGDSIHVLTAVWQGRVHVFWLTVIERFVESPVRPRGDDLKTFLGSINFPAPSRRYDASVSWSERTPEGWTEPVKSDIYDLTWDRKSQTPGLYYRLPSVYRLTGDDFADTNIGLWKNQFHVTFENERTIVLNLETTARRPGDTDDSHNAFAAMRHPDQDGGSGGASGGVIGPRPTKVGGEVAKDTSNEAAWSGPGGVGFALSSKFEPPLIIPARRRQPTPLADMENGPPTGLHRHEQPLAGPLEADYATELSPDGSATNRIKTTILGTHRHYRIVPCSNPVAARTTTGEPSYARGLLQKPFFYQDHEHTFLVEPSVSTRVVRPHVSPEVHRPDIGALAAPPPSRPISPISPTDPIHEEWVLIGQDIVASIHPTSLGEVDLNADWLAQPATVIEFNGALIGGSGFLGSMARAADVNSRAGRSHGSATDPPRLHLVERTGVSTSGSRRMAALARPLQAGPGAPANGGDIT